MFELIIYKFNFIILNLINKKIWVHNVLYVKIHILIIGINYVQSSKANYNNLLKSNIRLNKIKTRNKYHKVYLTLDKIVNILHRTPIINKINS
jgi:hypothetical protein